MGVGGFRGKNLKNQGIYKFFNRPSHPTGGVLGLKFQGN